jgi:hypothetical protein
MGRIKKIIWLDGGHSGGKDTWVTSSDILSSFPSTGNIYSYSNSYIWFLNFLSIFVLGIMVDIHVTPYQVNDDRRPWISKEERQFHTNLKKLGVVLFRKVHFAEEPPSLENHFLLLKLFC